MIRVELWARGKRSTEVLYSTYQSHQISWFMIVVVSGFSTAKFLFSPFHIVLCGRKSLCRTHIWGVWDHVLLLRGHRIYMNYLEFYKGDVPIYSFNWSFISVWIHIYFVVWFIIQYFILLLKSFQLLCFLFPDSSCIFPVYFLFSSRISHFPKESWFLLLENGTRNWDLGTGCVHSCRSVISFRPFQLTAWKYICALTNVYTRISIFQYVIIYIYIKLNMCSYWCLQL